MVTHAASAVSDAITLFSVPEVYISDTAVLQRLPSLFLVMAGGCLALQVRFAVTSAPPGAET